MRHDTEHETCPYSRWTYTQPGGKESTGPILSMRHGLYTEHEAWTYTEHEAWTYIEHEAWHYDGLWTYT